MAFDNVCRSMVLFGGFDADGEDGETWEFTSISIPAVSSWGLLIMTLVMLTAGTLVYARRRPAQTSSSSNAFGTSRAP